MLIAFGMTAIFRPCLIPPPAALLLEEPPAEPVALLEDEDDDELPQAASAMAAASAGIQRMPLMRMVLLLVDGPATTSTPAGGRAGQGVRGPVRWPASPRRGV